MPPHPDLERFVVPEGPLDLGLTLSPLQVGGFDPNMRMREGAAVLAFHLAGGPVTLDLLQTDAGVRARAWGPGSAQAMEQLPALLGLHDDPSSFEPDHPLLRDLHRRMPGMRFSATHRVVDALVPTILGQLVTWKEAARAWTGFLREHGEPAPGPYGLRMLPTAKTLRRTPDAAWIAVGALGKQARTIRRVAEVAHRLEEVVALPLHEASRRLQSVPGVGPWTAMIAIMRAAGHADAVPIGDFHLPNDVAWALAGEARGDDDRMLELLEPFRGNRGRVIRLLLASGTHAPRRGPRLAIRPLDRL